jgi:hypothetical protein
MGFQNNFVRASAAPHQIFRALILLVVVSVAGTSAWAQDSGPGPLVVPIIVGGLGPSVAEIQPPGGRIFFVRNQSGIQQEFVLTRTRLGVTVEILRVVLSVSQNAFTDVFKHVAGDVLLFSTVGNPQWDTPIQIVGNTSIGVYAPSSAAWFLKNEQSPGPADTAFSFGPAGSNFTAFSGDWNGDGFSTPGLYDPATGAVFLKNTYEPGDAHYVFTYGPGGNTLTVIAGDWNGDGFDSLGLYDAATGAFFLRNDRSSGDADVVFTFGAGGLGYTPIAGDWNGDGVDTVGLYDASTGTFFLRNSNTPGPADLVYGFGPANMRPVVGDWNGDGLDTVGVYIAATGTWFLRNAHEPGPADAAFSYGAGGLAPIAGNWEAVYRDDE